LPLVAISRHHTATGDRWNPEREVNLLAMIDTDRDWSQGTWTNGPQGLESSKGFGSRIELPYTPPDEYRLCVITGTVKPLP
jgi:hypothetical protein